MTHIIITRLEVLPELPTCDRDKSGKMARMDFLPAGCHEPLVCKKCSEATHRTGGMLVSGLAPRLCLCDRLISLSLTSSRPVHVVAGVGISLPFMGYIPLRADHIHAVLCPRTLGLLPPLGDCEPCSCEVRVHIPIRGRARPSCTYPRKGKCWAN